MMSAAGKGVNVPRSLKKYVEGWERVFGTSTDELKPLEEVDIVPGDGKLPGWVVHEVISDPPVIGVVNIEALKKLELHKGTVRPEAEEYQRKLEYVRRCNHGGGMCTCDDPVDDPED